MKNKSVRRIRTLLRIRRTIVVSGPFHRRAGTSRRPYAEASDPFVGADALGGPLTSPVQGVLGVSRRISRKRRDGGVVPGTPTRTVDPLHRVLPGEKCTFVRNEETPTNVYSVIRWYTTV